MEKNSVASLLTSVDSLFTTQEDIATQPRVQEIPVDKIDDFPNHPFKVRMDDNMIEMAESVKQHGILVPAIVRPKVHSIRTSTSLWRISRSSSPRS